jgi:hypothetical protein
VRQLNPNLAFKRTPNGRPRNGIMFILALRGLPFGAAYLYVRFLQEAHAQCELAVMCKAMHAAEGVQSLVLRCCAAARSKVSWFVGADRSVGRGCRTHRGLSVLRRPAHGFFAHRPSRARSFSRGACALGVGCTSRASAACEPRVAASREAVAYCGMRKAALLQHPGLAEVVRKVQA